MHRGTLLIILGIILIAGAMGLAAYNFWDSDRAGQAAGAVLQELEEQIDDAPATAVAATDGDGEPASVELDGARYLGYISVPSVGLELPVANEWSYDQLEVSPCRYTGSYVTNDLVICGHNYRSHFRKLHSADIGADVYLVTVDGTRIHYIVSNLETLEPTSIDQMVQNDNNTDGANSDWDMTLFTCNLGGQTRFAVRCIRQD